MRFVFVFFFFNLLGKRSSLHCADQGFSDSRGSCLVAGSDSVRWDAAREATFLKKQKQKQKQKPQAMPLDKGGLAERLQIKPVTLNH